MSEQELINNGKIIKSEVEKLKKIVFNSYNYSGKEREYAKTNIIILWDTCKHKYEWIDCNPYNEICKCIYCDADSPRTRYF